jgi:hypothetical protein
MRDLMTPNFIEKPTVERDLPAYFREAFLDYDPVFVDSPDQQPASEFTNRSDSRRVTASIEGQA